MKNEILMYTDELLDMTAKDLIKEIDLKDPAPNEIFFHIKNEEYVHGDVAESYMSMSMYLNHQ